MSEMQHTCFVALTRPPMKFGVTLQFLVLDVMLHFMLFFTLNALGFSKWILIATVIVSYMGGRAACHYDPHFFSLLFGKVVFLSYNNNAFWGCHSYEPY